VARSAAEERIKLLTAENEKARALRAERVPVAPLLPRFRTDESGTVIDRRGEIVYKPPVLPPLVGKVEKKT